jgi:hypothetical protein
MLKKSLYVTLALLFASSAGDYSVYAWWTEGTNRPTNAPYTINYKDGSDTVYVSQKVNPEYGVKPLNFNLHSPAFLYILLTWQDN